MTRTTNARLAGFMFLFYIAIGLTSLALFRQATGLPRGPRGRSRVWPSTRRPYA